MIVAGAARIERGQDGAEAITTLTVGKEVPAIAEAGIVVFAVFIGMPYFDERSLNRTAQAGQDLTIEFHKSPLGLRLDEIGALRRIRFEIWPLRLSDSRFITIVTLRSRSSALREN
jgi:hypothetical protein